MKAYGLLNEAADAVQKYDDEFARYLRNRARDRRRVRDVDTTGVDQDEALAAPLADELLAVTRHSGALVHDGRAGLGQPVDERRLADVRKADDRHRP